jgi:signal transduction histidine kinase
VIAQAHLLQLRIPEDHPAFKSARTIYEASMRAAQVVERMLDLARINTYDVRPLDVNRTLRSALSLLAGQIDADRLELVTDFDEEIPEISASALHLEDVWINLMINARDAIGPEQHGRIEVRTRWHPRMQQVEVNIKDNGPGIPPEHRDQLFNPFFTTKTRGTGLGLSICHEVIIYHGGTIEVAESSPQGTTFRVMLPVSPPDLTTVRDGEKNQL